jgi:hypothetical protein
MKTKKLSQTKSAIRRRELRRNETKDEKRLRLTKRYLGVLRYEMINCRGMSRRSNFYKRALVKCVEYRKLIAKLERKEK